jgi:hypothetical protein
MQSYYDADFESRLINLKTKAVTSTNKNLERIAESFTVMEARQAQIVATAFNVRIAYELDEEQEDVEEPSVSSPTRKRSKRVAPTKSTSRSKKPKK